MCPEIAPVKMEIARQAKGSDVYSNVYRTGMFHNGREFTNAKQTISLTQLCNADESANIKFSVCSAHSELSSVITTVAELRNGKLIH